MPHPPYAIISTTSHRRPRFGLRWLAGLVLAGVGVAATLMLRPADTLPAGVKAETITPAALTQPAKTPARTPVVRNVEAPPLLTRSASVCLTCGTVETVAGGGKHGASYQVRVRMDDGSVRDFTSTAQAAPGAAVRVEGRGFRVVNTGG